MSEKPSVYTRRISRPGQAPLNAIQSLLLPSGSCHVPALPHFGKRYRAGKEAPPALSLDPLSVMLCVFIQSCNAVSEGDDATAFHAPRNASPMKFGG